MPRIVVEDDAMGRPVIYLESDDGKRKPILELGPSELSVNVAGPAETIFRFSRHEKIDTPGGFIVYDKETGEVTIWQSKSGLYQVDGEQLRKII